ncbi:MAG TPA: Maf family protein [Acidobacteriaceae bacterium]|nr:Maf family protein [Acidobacteriaceae bacterium]
MKTSLTIPTPYPALVLASASPRRSELLAQAGFLFEVESIAVDETPRMNEPPEDLVQRLAREKATAVFQVRARRSAPALPVLGADTVVVCNGAVLGKPSDDEEAYRMLRLLAGRTHRVLTGVCLMAAAGTQTAVESTRVTMLAPSEEELRAYIATGEPRDKAGAYAIQGRAARWIPRVEGCYFNVVGLPLARVNAMIEAAENKTRAPVL